jgi:transposase
VDSREAKGLEIAARLRVVRDGAFWSVPSQKSNARYKVDPDAPSCTCEDFALRQLPCKHIYATRIVRERDGAGVAPAAPQEPQPEPKPAKRRTYKQTWSAYNAAQTNEKHKFQVLLADLCRGIVEPPPRQGRGRKPIPLRDAVFAACFKVYSTVSCRRFMSDLRDAHQRGHVGTLPHYNSIFNYLENPSLTPVLSDLVMKASLPLRTVEVDFAPDSSAFTTSKFVRWYDQKWGKVREWHQWVKLQMICGVKTNIITAAEVCEQDGPDSPYLPGLVEKTAENFTVREVSADKGYSAVACHDAVAAVGGTPFIAFKTVATGGSGGVWGKMYHYFQYRREEFLAHYHKRSNSESTFSMIKRKFGDALRSRTEVAMRNEVLCKVLCHNICVLVQEMYELGIDPVFWPEPACPENEGPAQIIRFPG